MFVSKSYLHPRARIWKFYVMYLVICLDTNLPFLVPDDLRENTYAKSKLKQCRGDS